MGITFDEVISNSLQAELAGVDKVTKATHAAAYYTAGAIGSDPEVFLTRKTTSGTEVLAPAWKYLPTAKTTPNFYADGFAAEIKPQAWGCNLSHLGYVKELLENVLAKCNSVTPTIPVKFNIKNYTKIAKKHLVEAPDEAVQLGCSASYNVYDERLEMPTDGRKLEYRTAGGHLHIGCGNQSAETVGVVVRNCDLVAGVGSVLLFQGFEDARRRVLYGRAGEFRLPKHGIEYRVPGSAILGSPTGFVIMMDLVKQAANWGIARCDLMEVLKIDRDKVREIINTLDVNAARELYEQYPWIWHRAMGLAYRYAVSMTDASTSRVAKVLNAVFTRGLGEIKGLKATGRVYDKNRTDWDTTGEIMPYTFGDVETTWKLGHKISDIGHSTQWPVGIYKMVKAGYCVLAGE